MRKAKAIYPEFAGARGQPPRHPSRPQSLTGGGDRAWRREGAAQAPAGAAGLGVGARRLPGRGRPMRLVRGLILSPLVGPRLEEGTKIGAAGSD